MSYLLKPLSLFTFILLFCLFSCRENNQYQGKSIFRYNVPNGISSLDPAFARNLENISAVNHIFNGLVEMDSNLIVRPSIAESWEVLDSGRLYKFHLRNDVFFHDHPAFKDGEGRRVNAEDFIFSFERIVNETLSSPGSWIFAQVEKRADERLAIEVLDSNTLSIRLKQAFPPFLGILSMQYCSVVPKEIVQKYGREFRSHPVGTGPFKLKLWKEGNKMVLLKNENYFEKDAAGNPLPYLNAISISFNKDEEVAFLKFIKGEIDYMSGLNGSYKDEILDTKGRLRKKYNDKVDLITQPYLNTEYLGFLMEQQKESNTENPLLDKRIRQAINYGFDREKMLKYLRNNIGTAATSGFVPRGLPSFDHHFKGFSYQPEKAKKLLQEAGFPYGKGLPEISLSTTGQYVDLCEFIQHQLGELGIKIKLSVNPPATHNELVAKSELAFFRKSWVADYPDAENYLSLFYSKNFSPEGPNYTHFKNEEYDRIYRNSLAEVNDSLRYKLYHQMDSIIIAEAVVVPLFYDEVVRFVRKDVKGMGINALNLLNLKTVKKEARITTR